MLVMKFTETSLICNLLLKAVSVSAETAVYAYITDALAERPWLPKNNSTCHVQLQSEERKVEPFRNIGVLIATPYYTRLQKGDDSSNLNQSLRAVEIMVSLIKSDPISDLSPRL